MGKKKATKKVKKEPEILPEPKRRRISLDDDDIQIIDFRPGEPIELDENSPNSDQVRKNKIRMYEFVSVDAQTL